GKLTPRGPPMIRILIACLAVALFAPVAPAQPAGAKMRLYVGTYTGAKSKGIYLFDFDPATGKLVDAGLAGEATNPSFLAFHPTQPILYAVAEGGGKGAVASFKVDDESGKLTFLNKESSGGNGPCHVSVDRTGKVC